MALLVPLSSATPSGVDSIEESPGSHQTNVQLVEEVPVASLPLKGQSFIECMPYLADTSNYGRDTIGLRARAIFDTYCFGRTGLWNAGGWGNAGEPPELYMETIGSVAYCQAQCPPQLEGFSNFGHHILVSDSKREWVAPVREDLTGEWGDVICTKQPAGPTGHLLFDRVLKGACLVIGSSDLYSHSMRMEIPPQPAYWGEYCRSTCNPAGWVWWVSYHYIYMPTTDTEWILKPNDHCESHTPRKAGETALRCIMTRQLSVDKQPEAPPPSSDDPPEHHSPSHADEAVKKAAKPVCERARCPEDPTLHFRYFL